MRIEAVDVMTLGLPLRTPWETASGVLHRRDVILLRVRTDVGDGWGECAALPDPGYSPEFVAGARLVLEQHLIPAVIGRDVTAKDVGAGVTGHPMAKSALEMALLDAEMRSTGQSFAERLGTTRTRVPAGVAVGFAPTPAELCDRVAAYVDEGYRRVKLKVGPGRDLAFVAAVRDCFPALALHVDANGAYAHDDVEHLTAFDEFGLQQIEQPFAADDLVGHARLAERMSTPVCLDEPIVSLAALETAVALGACDVVNLKPGRVGGYLEAARIEAWCRGRVPLWCGGMLETGLARAANVALAGLDGFTLTGDLSANSRFYEHDITEPVHVEDGWISVPTGPGFGVEVDPEAVERFRL